MVKCTDNMKGVEILPQRWVVERAFAWLSFNRKISKGYEFLLATSETFICISMIRLIYTNRLYKTLNLLFLSAIVTEW